MKKNKLSLAIGFSGLANAKSKYIRWCISLNFCTSSIPRAFDTSRNHNVIKTSYSADIKTRYKSIVKKNKMVKHLFVFLIISLFSKSNLVAQDSNIHFSIGIVPTYLVDPITPSISFAIEHGLSEKINGEIMYGFDPNIKVLSWHKDPFSKHHEYKLTLKYLVNAKDQKDYFYYAIDYFGNYNKYNRINNYYQENDIYFGYDAAEVIRTVNGLRLNIGHSFNLKGNIWLDSFFGVGIRKINIQYLTTNTSIIANSQINTRDELWTPFDRIAGNRLKVAFILGFKVSYRFY